MNHTVIKNGSLLPSQFIRWAVVFEYDTGGYDTGRYSDFDSKHLQPTKTSNSYRFIYNGTVVKNSSTEATAADDVFKILIFLVSTGSRLTLVLEQLLHSLIASLRPVTDPVRQVMKPMQTFT